MGICADLGATEIRMSAAFPAWPGDRTKLILDAGLVRIDDINDWTSQAFGIGEIGEIFDATENTVTLDLIGVRARVRRRQRCHGGRDPGAVLPVRVARRISIARPTY